MTPRKWVGVRALASLHSWHRAQCNSLLLEHRLWRSRDMLHGHYYVTCYCCCCSFQEQRSPWNVSAFWRDRRGCAPDRYKWEGFAGQRWDNAPKAANQKKKPGQGVMRLKRNTLLKVVTMWPYVWFTVVKSTVFGVDQFKSTVRCWGDDNGFLFLLQPFSGRCIHARSAEDSPLNVDCSGTK